MTSVAELRVAGYHNSLEQVLTFGLHSLHGAHMTPDDVRSLVRQFIDQLDLRAAKAEGYWYRRALTVEVAAEEVVAAANQGIGSYLLEAHPAELEEAIRFARHVLMNCIAPADIPNFEDYIRNRRQQKILAWVERTFATPEVPITPEMQAIYFLEEALELYQAVVCRAEPGYEIDVEHWMTVAANLVQKVMWKAIGEPRKEIGDVMVSMSSLAQRLNISIAEAERDEFARVLSVPRDESHARYQKKREEGF